MTWSKFMWARKFMCHISDFHFCLLRKPQHWRPEVEACRSEGDGALATAAWFGGYVFVQNQYDTEHALDQVLLFSSSNEWTELLIRILSSQVLVIFFRWFTKKLTFIHVCLEYNPIFNLSFKLAYERFWYKEIFNF